VIEVVVRNFQSIEKASFRIDGFTVVVGRSNIGKSALVRAVKAALTGAPATSFVRHGAGCLRRTKKAKTCKCFASVHLCGEGLDLLWEKGDSINRYTFNGAVYDKAERGTPDFLYPDFAPVKVGDRQEMLQVADQFSPIFLLDQTGGTVADTLSDVARLDRINAAMRLAEKDRKEAASTRKVREKDAADLRKKLTAYDGLDDVLGQAQALSDRHDDIERHGRSVVRMDGLLEHLAALVGAVRGLEGVTSVAVPDPSAMMGDRARLDQIDGFLVRLTDREREVEALSGVEDVLAPSAAGIEEGARSLQRLDGWLARLVDMKGWLAPWRAVEAAPVLDASGIREARDLVVSLDRFVTGYEALTVTVAGLEADLAAVQEDFTRVERERAALGVCPTCVRPVSECAGVE
jgi:hypothetical protein